MAEEAAQRGAAQAAAEREAARDFPALHPAARMPKEARPSVGWGMETVEMEPARRVMEAVEGELAGQVTATREMERGGWVMETPEMEPARPEAAH
jgi:hypothetical protein